MPFIAKNQFKKQIRRQTPQPKRDSIQEKIAMIMNPMQMTLTKDHVKVLLHIMPRKQSKSLSLPAIESMDHYENLNEVCIRMQSGIAAGEVELLERSAIQRYLKGCQEIDTAKTKPTKPAP